MAPTRPHSGGTAVSQGIQKMFRLTAPFNVLDGAKIPLRLASEKHIIEASGFLVTGASVCYASFQLLEKIGVNRLPASCIVTLTGVDSYDGKKLDHPVQVAVYEPPAHMPWSPWNPETEIILGMTFMQHFTIIFDSKAHEVVLKFT
jgi:hypothetical protein